MVLVTGILHENWVDRLFKLDKKVYERVDPELDPPFDKNSDLVKYRKDRAEFSMLGGKRKIDKVYEN
jgi:hypothetical protein